MSLQGKRLVAYYTREGCIDTDETLYRGRGRSCKSDSRGELTLQPRKSGSRLAYPVAYPAM